MTLLLSDTDYLARAGIPFLVPIHPGTAPIAAAAAVAVQIAEAIRAYNQAIANITLYHRISAALTAQILTAVNSSFLSALEDLNVGFSDISPCDMLAHLRAEYGAMTPKELERNLAALSEPWNIDDPTIKDLWAKISHIQCVATLGQVPIPDITVITLILAMIEKTGLLAATTKKFRLQPANTWTLPTSSPHSNLATRSAFATSLPATPVFLVPTRRSPLLRHLLPRRRCCHTLARCPSCARLR
jgi:hypothetical protein